MTELILLSIFIVVVGIWLVSYKVFQLIDKTYLDRDKDEEPPYLYYIYRVWAVTGLIGGFIGVVFGTWAVSDTMPPVAQGLVPNIFFYVIYLLGLSAVHWLIKNRYTKAVIYSIMLAIYLTLTVLFNVFVSSEMVVKIFTTLLMLIIYLLFTRRSLVFLETENGQQPMPM